MKIGVIICSIILVIAVFFYTWFNRDSDRVVLTFATAMLLGSLGFVTKEAISNKSEIYTKEIPIVAFYEIENYKPLNIQTPFSFDLFFCLQNLQNSDIPIEEEKKGISFASEIYFDVIEYTIIKKVFERYSNAWNVKTKRISTPNGEQLSWMSLRDKGKILNISDVMQQIPENYFVKAHLYETIPANFGGKTILPPNTTVEIQQLNNHEVSYIFKNLYITLSIKVSLQSSLIGIGEYSKLLNLPITQDITKMIEAHSNYLMEIEIEQNIWLNGHPDMKKYRTWTNSIVDLLDSTFNYNSIREDHLKKYQLHGTDAIKFLPERRDI